MKIISGFVAVWTPRVRKAVLCIVMYISAADRLDVADAAGLDGLRDGVYPVGRQVVTACRTSAHLEHEIKHI